MPIKVTCVCGQSFAAKDELAGRRVKCPKCSQPLAIPAAGAIPAAPAGPQLQPMAAPAPAPVAAQPVSPGGLFDEVGLSSAPTGTMPCPGCRAPMPMGGVVCVQCGYNLRLGRRMETMRIGADGLAAGSSVADMVLAKAARALEEDKIEQQKKTKEGLPWWAYLLMLIGVISFMAMMMMIPQRNAMMAAAGVVMFVGWLICVYSGIALLVTAFRESPLQGILYMVVPFYPLIYIVMRWEKTAGYFFMNLGGTVIVFVGLGILWFSQLFVKEDQVMAPLIQDGIMLAQSCCSLLGFLV